MKKSRFTEEQMAYALKQAELDTAVREICRKMGISEATFYVWRKKYGGLDPSRCCLGLLSSTRGQVLSTPQPHGLGR